jgi:hypothetical protein
MKIKALKEFQSMILSMDEGEVRDLELDSYILNSWIGSGLIEEVKKVNKKSVKTNEG